MSRTNLGIDIGGTGVKVAHQSAGVWSLGTSERYERPSREQLLRSLREAVARAQVKAPDITNVGLCVPGIPSSDGNRIDIAVNVPGLVGWDFADLVQEALGRKPERITRLIDADAAATDWLERHKLSGRTLVLVLGTGVGMCVLDDGAPLRITDGGSGHIGQIDVSLTNDAPIGPDGGRGGLEAYLGVRAILSQGAIEQAFLADAPATLALARAIRIAHAIYRPDRVVMLGGIGIRIPFLEPIDTAVRKHLTSIAKPGWQLLQGDDDHHAARGAARLA